MALTSRSIRPTLFRLSAAARVTTKRKCSFCGRTHQSTENHATVVSGRIKAPAIVCTA